MSNLDDWKRGSLIELKAFPDRPTGLQDIGLYLIDINLFYEISRLLLDPEYKQFQFSRYTTYRNRHRLREGDQLQLISMHEGSPLLLVAGIVAAGFGVRYIRHVVEDLGKIVDVPIQIVKNVKELDLQQETKRNLQADTRLKHAQAEQLEAENARQRRINIAESAHALQPGQGDEVGNQLRVQIVRRIQEAPYRTTEIRLYLPPEQES